MSFCGIAILLIAIHNAGASPAAGGLHEYFPGVRADLAAKLVEFDGRITPMLVKDDRAPLFFLEVLACSPNTREHETFIVSTVKPSHLHAAMLLIGLKPGEPGGWKLQDNQLIAHPPTGDRISVRIAYADKDGHEIEVDPLDWVVSTRDKGLFISTERKAASDAKLPAPGWVFAGSKFVKRKPDKQPEGGLPSDNQPQDFYDADGSGTIIGLTTFGSEVIAWSRVISPDANTTDPEWIADFSKTPPAETRIRVRIRAEPAR